MTKNISAKATSERTRETSSTPIVNQYRHLIPAVIEHMQIHREFFVAGLRSPDLLQSFLKQLPVSTRRSIEEFGSMLKERLLLASIGEHSSGTVGLTTSAFDNRLQTGPSTLHSPIRHHLTLGPSTPTKYTDAQRGHLQRYKEALVGAPDRPCEPGEDIILPNPPQFGLSQGDSKKLKQFFAMPCNTEVVLYLHHVFVGGKDSIYNAVKDDDLQSHVSSNTLSQIASSKMAEALQFAATMWIQRYPNDPAAQIIEQQRCRKAGVALSHHDALRMLSEEHTHLARVANLEAAANISRKFQNGNQQSSLNTSSNQVLLTESKDSKEEGTLDDDEEEKEEMSGDEDDEAQQTSANHSPHNSINHSQQTTTGVMLLPRTNSGSPLSLSLSLGNNTTAAARKSQARLERQMKQLLLCNLKLHFPEEAHSWTVLLATRDECLQNLKDERISLESLAAEINGHFGTAAPLATSFVKLIVLAENACNGLSHTNYNAAPTDIANLLISKLSPIVIEANLLKATHLQEAVAVVEGKGLDEVKELIEAQKKYEVENSGTKKGPLSFIAKKLNKKDSAAPSPVSALELSAAFHVEELAAVANRCLKATQLFSGSSRAQSEINIEN